MASVQIGGTQQKLSFNQSQQGITLFQNGQSYKFAYIRQDFNQADSQADEGHLKAPMPGVVTQVLVSANHSVKKDDILMTLEAMKMEYTIRAPKDGVIVDSYFQVGDQVKAGDELVEFQPAQEEVAWVSLSKSWRSVPETASKMKKQALTVEQRLNFINDLINAGLKSIEVGSCVSAKWVPQMAQSDELFKLLPQTTDVQFSLLTPISKVLKLLKR